MASSNPNYHACDKCRMPVAPKINHHTDGLCAGCADIDIDDILPSGGGFYDNVSTDTDNGDS